METHNELTPIKAAWQAKCPRCRKGNIFTGRAYGFKLQRMNETCSHCSLRFEREPGYFYVAMFISYAFVVAELIAVCVGTYILTGYLEGPWLYLIVSLIATLLFAPFNFRYSRVVLLYWLTPGLHYEPTLTKEELTKL